MAVLKVYAILFALVIATGFVLMCYYIPTPQTAAGSSGASDAIRFPLVVRGMHFWLGIAITITGIRLAWVSIVGRRFQAPTRLLRSWAIAIFILTALLAASGLLLPWDSLAAVTIGDVTKAVGFRPTLLQIYTLHTIGLPVVSIALLIGYFRVFRKDGRQLLYEALPD